MIRDIFFTLSMSLLPRSCAGCHEHDYVLCPHCFALFQQWHARRVSSSCTIFSCAYYSNEVRRSILSWKDHGDEELNKPFCAVISSLCLKIIHSIVSEYTYEEDAIESICIVPVPSSPQSLKHRGREHLIPLARSITQEINNYISSRNLPIRAHICTCLSIDKKVHKSVTAPSREQRLHRLDNHLYLNVSHDVRHRYAIVIDDIVTTGSTVRACIRLLKTYGIRTMIVLTLADAQHNIDSESTVMHIQ